MNTLSAALYTQEVSEHTRSQPTPTFKIALNEIPIAIFYVTPTDYIFAWEGNIDFGRLEDEVNSALNVFGWRDLSLYDASWHYRVSASLILPHKEGFDELQEYDFSIPEAYTRYREVMRRSSELSFVRYDINNNFQQGLAFSCTAENAALQPDLDSEVTISVERRENRPRLCTAEMFYWVMAHHRQSHFLKDAIVDPAFIMYLNQYIV